MTIKLATHYGMCFGVRDALRTTHIAATAEPVTILGQLVHNPEVDRHLRHLGVDTGTLDGVGEAKTQRVIITAHGASDRLRQKWLESGHQVTDTSCPLVRKAHQALQLLVDEGYAPVVVGQSNHVEVKGLIGDFPDAVVILNEHEIAGIPNACKIGVISQTTQPLMNVLQLVDAIKQQRPKADVRFVDTVCHPTKQRQAALEELCEESQVVIVVGGNNSNNTRQLVERARAKGVKTFQVERPEDLKEEWFRGVDHVGLTAGTSTLDETVAAVQSAIQQMALHLDGSSAVSSV
ncbi:MAG: 4-hydroxy-3-methylbut-2-enyl diphosphate reductase [Verrucomicrobiaceae bacterium]|nr:4-hydroxy-3-methylbut-2-enyl diphosphate reductase [Verrucomicrobiaceae bacterium]